MSISVLREDKRWQIPATVVTVALSMLVPILVHAIGGPTSGARWLPLFYAPFLAVFFFHPAVSIVAGLVTPFLNHALTGMPPIGIATVLSIELVVFALASQVFLRRWANFWAAAPIAYFVAKVASMLLLFIVPLVPTPPWQYFTNSLTNAWPGMLALLLLNVLVQKGIHRGK